jgi:hypothetical protein
MNRHRIEADAQTTGLDHVTGFALEKSHNIFIGLGVVWAAA